MSHVDLESWRRLRAGTCTPAEGKALLAHSAEPCEACDALVDGIDDLALDCAVDGALAAVSRRPADDALLLRRVEARVVAPVGRRAPPRWLYGVPIALAAGLALLVLRAPTTEVSSQRLKGEGGPPALSAVVAAVPGARLEPLQKEKVYPQTAELFFTYTLSTDTHLYLGRVGVDGSVEAFYPPIGAADAVHRAGTSALNLGGTVQGYALRGLSGKQRFVAVASDEPLQGDRLTEAVRRAADDGAMLEIEVAPP